MYDFPEVNIDTKNYLGNFNNLNIVDTENTNLQSVFMQFNELDGINFEGSDGTYSFLSSNIKKELLIDKISNNNEYDIINNFEITEDTSYIDELNNAEDSFYRNLLKTNFLKDKKFPEITTSEDAKDDEVKLENNNNYYEQFFGSKAEQDFPYIEKSINGKSIYVEDNNIENYKDTERYKFPDVKTDENDDSNKNIVKSENQVILNSKDYFKEAFNSQASFPKIVAKNNWILGTDDTNISGSFLDLSNMSRFFLLGPIDYLLQSIATPMKYQKDENGNTVFNWSYFFKTRTIDKMIEDSMDIVESFFPSIKNLRGVLRMGLFSLSAGLPSIIRKAYNIGENGRNIEKSSEEDKNNFLYNLPAALLTGVSVQNPNATELVKMFNNLGGIMETVEHIISSFVMMSGISNDSFVSLSMDGEYTRATSDASIQYNTLKLKLKPNRSEFFRQFHTDAGINRDDIRRYGIRDSKSYKGKNPFIKKLLELSPDLFSNQFDIFIEIVPKSYDYNAALKNDQEDEKIFIEDLHDLINQAKTNSKSVDSKNKFIQSPLILSSRLSGIDIPLKNSSQELTDFKYLGTSLIKTDSIRNTENKSKFSLRGDSKLYLVDVFNKLSETHHRIVNESFKNLKVFQISKVKDEDIKFLDVVKCFPTRNYYINVYVKRIDTSVPLASKGVMTEKERGQLSKGILKDFHLKFNSLKDGYVTIIKKCLNTINTTYGYRYAEVVKPLIDMFKNKIDVSLLSNGEPIEKAKPSLSKLLKYATGAEKAPPALIYKGYIKAGEIRIPFEETVTQYVSKLKILTKDKERDIKMCETDLRSIEKETNSISLKSKLSKVNLSNYESIIRDYYQKAMEKQANDDEKAYTEKVESLTAALARFDDAMKSIKDLSEFFDQQDWILEEETNEQTLYQKYNSASMYDVCDFFIFEDCKFLGTTSNIELSQDSSANPQSFNYDFIFKRFVIDTVENPALEEWQNKVEGLSNIVNKFKDINLI